MEMDNYHFDDFDRRYWCHQVLINLSGLPVQTVIDALEMALMVVIRQGAETPDMFEELVEETLESLIDMAQEIETLRREYISQAEEE